MSSWQASSPSALLNITKISCWPHLHLMARFRRFPDTLSRPKQSILEREHVWISHNNSCRASLLIHILRLSFLAPFYKVKYILISHMWETKPGIKIIRPFLSFQIFKSIKKYPGIQVIHKPFICDLKMIQYYSHDQQKHLIRAVGRPWCLLWLRWQWQCTPLSHNQSPHKPVCCWGSVTYRVLRTPKHLQPSSSLDSVRFHLKI